MTWNTSDTICAIASGPQGALRGIVRIAGPLALKIYQRLIPIDSADQAHFGLPKRATRRSHVFQLGEDWGSIPCDAWIWPNHRSYVGQPTVELHCVGSLPILERTIELACQHGARMAAPGEFTLRAFLAGRMDLAQCEAVLGVIHASSTKVLDIALKQLAGGLKIPIEGIRQSLIELLADLEAGLDFVDEDIEFISRREIERRLTEATTQIKNLMEQLEQRSLRQNGARIVILGQPNAGKSSLLNALHGVDVALVSDQAGTTRDYLRIASDDFAGELIDTAGIEEKIDHSPRSLAQDFTRQQTEQADLRLLCIDLSLPPERWTNTLPIASSNRKNICLNNSCLNNNNAGGSEGCGDPDPEFEEASNRWWIGTKLDLASQDSLDVWRALVETESQNRNFLVSSRSGEGIDALKESLIEWQRARDNESANLLPSTLARCKTALASACQSLEEALISTQADMGDELIASELRIALHLLGVVAGEVYTDDILDALFSRFCIGK